jgi:hypothetical protein
MEVTNMKELKRTVTTETVWGYEAEDGTIFTSKDECERYEASAYAVAEKSARQFRVKDINFDSVLPWFCSDETVYIYDVPTLDAMRIINTFLHLRMSSCNLLEANCVGHKVAVLFNNFDSYYDILGTQEEMENEVLYHIRRAFEVKQTST